MQSATVGKLLSLTTSQAATIFFIFGVIYFICTNTVTLGKDKHGLGKISLRIGQVTLLLSPTTNKPNSHSDRKIFLKTLDLAFETFL